MDGKLSLMVAIYVYIQTILGNACLLIDVLDHTFVNGSTCKAEANIYYVDDHWLSKQKLIY